MASTGHSGNTGFAIDALFGVDVQHLGPFVEALDRANNYAQSVITAAIAGLSHYVSH